MENKLATIKERMLYIAKLKGVRLTDFCESIGQTYGNYKGENLKKAVSSDVLARLLSVYPDANPDFILRGVGDAISPSPQVGGHSLSISGDNHGTNMIGLNATEVHNAGGSPISDHIQSLTSEIAYLRELLLKRDAQMIELVQRVMDQSSRDNATVNQ